MVKFRRAMGVALCVLIAVGGILMVFLPLPKRVGAAKEQYLCIWDDGTQTVESYLSAMESLVGIAEDGCVELKRGTHVGKIPTQKAFSDYDGALRRGTLSDLLQLKDENFSRIERAALFREYGNAVYYSVDTFCYTGAGVVQKNIEHAEKVILLSGTLPVKYLQTVGAKELRLSSEAEFTADRLLGSRIEEFEAASPYAVEGDALLLTVAGQKRLVAAPPAATALSLPDYDYADEGALAACTCLESLTLPFAGNAKRSTGTDFDGTFAHLFSAGEAYLVPGSLKRVKILGGRLVSHAFYACPDIQEADVCGLDPNAIARDAFADMVGWKSVHSPRSDLILTGEYKTSTAPCGCTVFKRI